MTRNAWGHSCAYDFVGADVQKISSPEEVKRYVVALCDAIKMKPYGEPWVEKFASHDYRLYGITLLQAIETSCITVHFAENTGEVYLDVFSCAEYDPEVPLHFTESYFSCTGKLVASVQRGLL